jgi:alpha-ketoglutarate-dependent taurine dioxygenase
MTGTLRHELAQRGPVSGSLIGTPDTRMVAYGPLDSGQSVVPWITEHRAELMSALHEYGAVLVRGAVDNAELLEQAARVIGGELLAYTERTTPRSSVSGNVYTSTEYPSSQTIPQHNESAYSRRSPRWLFFACVTPSESGGETPLADSAAVLRHLPEDLVERFRERGVRYTCSYRPGMGLTWQEVFQTDSKAEVEKYCDENGLEFEWLSDEELRTRSRRPAIVTDPETGREVWFNQAHLFHVTNLPKKVQAALVEMYDEADYPKHAFYGDGSSISDKDLELIRKAYQDTIFANSWERGDLMIVNNLRVSHGRRPYTGARRVLVAMTGVFEVA